MSNIASVTPPPGQAGLFIDDFETGNLSRWTIVTGLTAQQQEFFSGSWGARGNSTGAATWAYKQLSPGQTSLYYRIRFKIVNHNGTVNLMKFRTGAGAFAPWALRVRQRQAGLPQRRPRRQLEQLDCGVAE